MNYYRVKTHLKNCEFTGSIHVIPALNEEIAILYSKITILEMSAKMKMNLHEEDIEIVEVNQPVLTENNVEYFSTHKKIEYFNVRKKSEFFYKHNI